MPALLKPGQVLPAPGFPQLPVAIPVAFRHHLIYAGASVADVLALVSRSQGASRQANIQHASAYLPKNHMHFLLEPHREKACREWELFSIAQHELVQSNKQVNLHERENVFNF